MGYYRKVENRKEQRATISEATRVYLFFDGGWLPITKTQAKHLWREARTLRMSEWVASEFRSPNDAYAASRLETKARTCHIVVGFTTDFPALQHSVLLLPPPRPKKLPPDPLRRIVFDKEEDG